MASYDLIVIGGGPAGYVGAIRAAQLGKKVACVEKERAGGTCLNWGCIPTKALLKNAELYHTMKHHADDFGMSIEGLSYDWNKVIKRSRNVSDKLAGGIEFLFKKNKVDYIRGVGGLAANGKVEVIDTDGKSEMYTTKDVLVATGCVSRELPFLPFDGKKVIGSREAMNLPKQPKSITIIGAGAIGIEFAYFFNAYGTEVTVVEMLDKVLPVEDNEVSKLLEKSLTSQGIKILTGTKTTEADTSGDGVKLTVEPAAGGESQTIESEIVLVAIGIAPVLPNNAEQIKLERGFIDTDENYMTSVPNVYAAGDITGPPWLAHTGSYEAIQCVEGLYIDGHKPKQVGTFPACTYCHPEVASVGLTEEACKEQGLDYRVGKFPFAASGRALAVAESEGFVKIIFDKKHGEILGAHMIGAGATELIAEVTLAMQLEATAEEIDATIHAHPTLAEAVHEATGDAYGHAIHI
ncbi:MAG: dihydrolipoyl dehydrogenase [Verrucomicrobiales bacterium]|jgi:dihydrolipoamide dehydrogenase|nr:dihydrolipoyl dehydrogenase [Verrucomicrobiales bacterium]